MFVYEPSGSGFESSCRKLILSNWSYNSKEITKNYKFRILEIENWRCGQGEGRYLQSLHIFPLLLCGDNVKNTACNQKRIFDPVKLRVKFEGKEIIHEIHRWNKIHHRCLTHSQTRLCIFTLDKAADWDQGFPCSNWSRPDFLLAHLNQKLMNSQSTALTYSLLNSL